MAIDPITGHYYVPYVSPALQTTSSDSASAALEGIAQDEEGESDSVTLSTQARGLDLNSLFADKVGRNGTVSLEDLEALGTQELDSFKDSLFALLKENGIDPTQTIELTLASDGRISVGNENSQKVSIEELIQGNPELEDQFKKAMSMLTLAAEGKEATEFQEAYRANPDGALSHYGYLFGTHLQGTAELSDQSSAIAFQRVSE